MTRRKVVKRRKGQRVPRLVNGQRSVILHQPPPDWDGNAGADERPYALRWLSKDAALIETAGYVVGRVELPADGPPAITIGENVPLGPHRERIFEAAINAVLSRGGPHADRLRETMERLDREGQAE